MIHYKPGYATAANDTLAIFAQRTSGVQLTRTLLIAFLCVTLIVPMAFAQYDPVQPYQGKAGRNLAETQQWWQQRDKHTAGAPNVVWILLDDVGYGAISTFGGLIKTPIMRLVNGTVHRLRMQPRSVRLTVGLLVADSITTTVSSEELPINGIRSPGKTHAR
jgi:hypothetical protein